MAPRYVTRGHWLLLEYTERSLLKVCASQTHHFFKKFSAVHSRALTSASTSTPAAITQEEGTAHHEILAPTVTTKVSPECGIFEPLPLPDNDATAAGLTRSQRLFAACTKIDPRSLTVGMVNDAEFYLFMDMRRESQWTSFGMTSRHWVIACRSYNRRLQVKAMEKGFAYIPKRARTMQAKLGDVESTVMTKICTGVYKCEYYSFLGMIVCTHRFTVSCSQRRVRADGDLLEDPLRGCTYNTDHRRKPKYKSWEGGE